MRRIASSILSSAFGTAGETKTSLVHRAAVKAILGSTVLCGVALASALASPAVAAVVGIGCGISALGLGISAGADLIKSYQMPEAEYVDPLVVAGNKAVIPDRKDKDPFDDLMTGEFGNRDRLGSFMVKTCNEDALAP